MESDVENMEIDVAESIENSENQNKSEEIQEKSERDQNKPMEVQDKVEKVQTKPMQVQDKSEARSKLMQVHNKFEQDQDKPMEVQGKFEEIQAKPMQVQDKFEEIQGKPMQVQDKSEVQSKLMQVHDKFEQDNPQQLDQDKSMEVQNKLEVQAKPTQVQDKFEEIQDKPMQVQDKSEVKSKLMQEEVQDKPILVQDKHKDEHLYVQAKDKEIQDKSKEVQDKSEEVQDKSEEVQDKSKEVEYMSDGNRESASETESMIIDTDLQHFDVLDDLDAHSNSEDDDSDDGTEGSNTSTDLEIPDEEIEAMLEEGLPEEFKGKRSDKRPVKYEEKVKLILEEKGYNHFDVLPEGWMQVSHNSGLPLYLHRPTRVMTLSRPYFLGPGSVRKHEIPVSSIPCLQYKRALKEEEEEKQREKERAQNAQDCTLPNAKVETVQENRIAQSLDGEAVRKYCEPLFRFKTIKVMRFKSWSQRRNFTKFQKQRKQLERPTLPDGTKLITFPVVNNLKYACRIPSPDKEPLGKLSRHWIMNPSGKSYVCILHEYVQHALKKQPTYKFKELENAATPYAAAVYINSMEYGCGFGSSKKQAKANAAKKTLEILIPTMKDTIPDDLSAENSSTSSQILKPSKGSLDADLSFFDEISITDPRVAEFCSKTTEPLPHQILITCLQRNFGLGDMDIKYSVKTLKHQRNEFTMKVGKHEATVICRNKKDGKQRAAQAILQRLHPHIHSWGSLLRLYGSRSVKSFKEKKQLEQEITLLQGKAAVNQPNHAILEKLRQEMKKLAEQKEAIKPIGKFIPPDLPTGSSSNLNNVDL